MKFKLNKNDFVDIVSEAFWRKYNECLGGCANESREALEKLFGEKFEKDGVPFNEKNMNEGIEVLEKLLKEKFETFLKELEPKE